MLQCGYGLNLLALQDYLNKNNLIKFQLAFHDYGNKILIKHKFNYIHLKPKSN